MRCVACDAALTVQESPWLPEQGRFEDMCRRCRVSIIDTTREPTSKELLQTDASTDNVLE